MIPNHNEFKMSTELKDQASDLREGRGAEYLKMEIAPLSEIAVSLARSRRQQTVRPVRSRWKSTREPVSASVCWMLEWMKVERINEDHFHSRGTKFYLGESPAIRESTYACPLSLLPLFIERTLSMVG